jgi:hypothetical protein
LIGKGIISYDTGDIMVFFFSYKNPATVEILNINPVFHKKKTINNIQSMNSNDCPQYAMPKADWLIQITVVC